MISQPTVYIVDDDPAFRNSLVELVSTMMFRARSFETAIGFLEQYDRTRPACLVADLHMSGMGGIELLEHLITIGITIPVIIVSGQADVRTSVLAMKSGAIDFIEKHNRPEAIRESIRAAIDFDMVRYEEETKHKDILKRLELLSSEERRVVEMFAQGITNKEIAEELTISLRTVHKRRESIFEKLAVTNRSELLQKIITFVDLDGNLDTSLDPKRDLP